MVNDMTVGRPLKVITAFAIPMFIGNIFQQVYNMVDSVVVGNYVGPEALAAVGSCNGAFSLLIAFIMGLTSGMSVLISQYFGAKNQDMVKRAFISASIVILCTGVVVTFLGILLSKTLLRALNTPEDVIELAHIYLAIMFAGTLANCLYNGVSAVLRALGDSIVPLIILVGASLINVGLDLLFVIVFDLGVAGVALATILAQFLSAVISLIYIFYKLPILRFKWHEVRAEKEIVKDICRIGFPAALSTCGVSISVMFLQRAVNAYGSTVMAGFTIGNKAENISMSLSFAIGMAVGTFCGQNIGAGRYDRVKKGMHVGYLMAIGYSVTVAILVFIFKGPLTSLFTHDATVMQVAISEINITLIFFPVLALLFVYQNFLRSAGDISPTVFMSVTEIIARGALGFVFSWFFGYIGIWWATPVGWTCSLIIGFIRYRSGAWKKKVYIRHEQES